MSSALAFEQPAHKPNTPPLTMQPGDDPAKPFVDMIAPALYKLESTKPTLPEGGDCSLDAAKVELVPNLDRWVEWVGQLEEFVWDFGEQLLGADLWIPTTDAVQDLKNDIRSLSEAITSRNTSYLQTHGFLSSPTSPTLHLAPIVKLLDNDNIQSLMDWSRARTNEARAQTIVVPVNEDDDEDVFYTDSPASEPEPTSAQVAFATDPFKPVF